MNQPVVNYDHKTIQMRRGGTSEWRRYGAVCLPAEGEICIEFFQDASGTRNGNVGIKVGNGTDVFSALPYLITNQNEDDRISDEQIQNWDLTVEKLANLTAAEIAQDNSALGDDVQAALNDLHSRLLAIDPDGGSIEIDDIPGLGDKLDTKAEQADLEQEILDRIAGDKALQDQIDAIDPDGDSDVDWSDIENKPTEFPPEAHDQGWDTITGKPADYPPSPHGHEIDEVNGLQDALDAAGGTPAWDDVTGKPSTYPPEDHSHEQGDIDGLELRLEAIEGSITDGGGFVDAPDDGKLYGRQSESWAEVVIPDGGASSWNDLTDKPTEFPPSAHNHDGVYQPAGDYIGEAPNDGEEYARKNQGWVKLQDHNYTGADAVKLTGDQSVAGHKTWTGIATFGDTVTMRGTLNGDDTANFQNAVTAGSFVKTGGTSSEYLMADGSVSSGPSGGGGDGEFVHIGEAPPADPQEGQQWMEVPADGDATMWIYDGGKWLQQPGGKDGAPGADGNIADATEQGVVATWDNAAGQWKPESRLKIENSKMSFSGNQYITAANPDDAEGYTQWSNTSGSMSVGMAGEAVNELLIFDRKEDHIAATYLGGASGGWEFWTNAQPRLTIDAEGNARFSGKVLIGGGASGSGGAISTKGNGGSSVWSDGVTRTRLARFENDESEDIHTSMCLWSDNNKGVVLQGATNSGSLSLATRTGSVDNINMTIDGKTGDAEFNANVIAEGVSTNSVHSSVSGRGGFVFASSSDILPANHLGADTDAVFSLGRPNDRFKDGHFSGTVEADVAKAHNFYTDASAGTYGIESNSRVNFFSSTNANDIKFAVYAGPSLALSVKSNKDAVFQGDIYKNGTTPLASTRDLIDTLSTLRNATKDETTLEGLRDAIGNAVGGLIEKFEAMQSTATQEIES